MLRVGNSAIKNIGVVSVYCCDKSIRNLFQIHILGFYVAVHSQFRPPNYSPDHLPETSFR